MMIEDLGLSLSLGPKSSNHQQQQQHPNFLNQFLIHKNPQRADMPSGLLVKRIDVNRTPVAEEEIRDSSEGEEANSAVSSGGGGGKRDHRDEGISDEDDADGSRKKLRLSKDQSVVLEESFKEHSTLNPKQKVALAKQLNLRARQVEVWFQNRRARTKLKQTEVDCEFLKRCCENLTEENRRLQKEVQELRALKLISPQQLCMHMSTPPTTLTMCPSCQRISSSSTSNNQHRPANGAAPWAPIPLRAPSSLQRS